MFSGRRRRHAGRNAPFDFADHSLTGSWAGCDMSTMRLLDVTFSGRTSSRYLHLCDVN